MDRSQMEKTFGGPVVFGRARTRRAILGWAAPEKHMWCATCFRVFPSGTHRNIDGRRVCPYADCAGPHEAAHDWSQVRRAHPNFPLDPWMAVRYPHTPARAEHAP